MIVTSPSTSSFDLWQSGVQNGKAYVGYFNIAAVASQYSTFALYNSTTSGKNGILKRVRGLSPGNNTCSFAVTNADVGATTQAAFNMGSRLSNNQMKYEAGAIATLYGGAVIYDEFVYSASTFFDYDNLYYTVPSGYSLILQCTTVNLGFQGSFYWLEL